MPLPRRVRRWMPAGWLLAVMVLQGCATAPQLARCGTAAAATADDPLEPLNRRVFAFNLALDETLIRPIAKTYRFLLPEFLRDRVRSVVDDLEEPLVVVNDLLQSRGHAASIAGRRFLINSTLGIAGMFDRATGFGFPRQSGDFGQTLYVWGIRDGPYIVLPVFGPTNLRDAAGMGIDFYASPVGHLGSTDVRRDVAISTSVADGIDLRSRNIETFDQAKASSLDFYAYLRSVTRQQRRAVLQEARAAPGDDRVPADQLIDPGEAFAPALPPPTRDPAAAEPAAADCGAR